MIVVINEIRDLQTVLAPRQAMLQSNVFLLRVDCWCDLIVYAYDKLLESLVFLKCN